MANIAENKLVFKTFILLKPFRRPIVKRNNIKENVSNLDDFKSKFCTEIHFS